MMDSAAASLTSSAGGVGKVQTAAAEVTVTEFLTVPGLTVTVVSFFSPQALLLYGVS